MFRFVSERLEKMLVHLLVHTIYVDNTFITFLIVAQNYNFFYYITIKSTVTAPKFHLDRSGAAAMETSASPQMPVAGAP